MKTKFIFSFLTIFVCNVGLLLATTQEHQHENDLRSIPPEIQSIKVLLIGNSYSQDAATQHLWEIAKADDKDIVIGILYEGGSALENHWNYASKDLANFSYYKRTNSGTKTTTSSQKMSDILLDEDWDVISFQQTSGRAGMTSSYYPYLENLLQYTKGIVSANRNVVYAFYQIWAFKEDFRGSADTFRYYDYNQMQMYDSIIHVCQHVLPQHQDIKMIIPGGTAIQNGRTSFIGDNFNRDGYHLDYGIGRYTVACTWYEKLFGKSAIGNSYNPGLPEQYLQVAQQAAHQAVENPFTITDLSDIPGPDDTYLYKLERPINFNLGSSVVQGWNNITSRSLGATLLIVEDEEGNETPLTLEITDDFGGTNANGPTNVNITNTTWSIPNDVSKNSFFGSGLPHSGKTNESGAFTISNLKPEQKIEVLAFGSNKNTTTNIETYMNVVGKGDTTVFVNGAQNTSTAMFVNNISPRSDGSIIITFGPGPNNVNATKYFYVNALTIRPDLSSPEYTNFTLENQVNINTGKGVAEGWNNITTYTEGTSTTNLVDVEGNTTPLAIEISEAFGGVNTNGITAVEIENTNWDIPEEVSKNSFYGNVVAHAGRVNPTCAFTIYNLNPEQALDILSYGSNKNTTVNNEIYMKVMGKEETTLYEDFGYNPSKALIAENIHPNQDGTLVVEFGPGPNNVQEKKFFYVNAFAFRPYKEPSTPLESLITTNQSIYLHKGTLYINEEPAQVWFYSFTGKLLFTANNCIGKVLLPSGSGIVKVVSNTQQAIFKKL